VVNEDSGTMELTKSSWSFPCIYRHS